MLRRMSSKIVDMIDDFENTEKVQMKKQETPNIKQLNDEMNNYEGKRSILK